MTQTRTIATARLAESEREMLAYAQMGGLTPGETREFLYYLDVAELPDGSRARVEAVVERILGDRLDPFTAARGDWDRQVSDGWQAISDRWDPETLTLRDEGER